MEWELLCAAASTAVYHVCYKQINLQMLLKAFGQATALVQLAAAAVKSASSSSSHAYHASSCPATRLCPPMYLDPFIRLLPFPS